jgi:hypothetical protein
VTIAAYALTGEGVVLGADSTSTVAFPGGARRYYNNEQKLFEVGDHGTLGVVTWGIGRMGPHSYRTHIADLSEELKSSPPADVHDVAKRFSAKMWSVYDHEMRAQIMAHTSILTNPNVPAQVKAPIESALSVGFCIAGHWLPQRESVAYELIYHPGLSAPPVPKPLTGFNVWGMRFFVDRLLGVDPGVADAVIASGKWTGSPEELGDILRKFRVTVTWPIPIREAVDAVAALLNVTIKMMKFTTLPPVCGGHLEIATITTDRRFRWVRHKSLAAALDYP